MDKDVTRFIAMVRAEANKEEDFAEERIKNTVLYKLLESKYDNINDIMKLALKKAEIYEQLRDVLLSIDLARKHLVITDIEKDKERLLIMASWKNKELYDKCSFRYGRPELLALAGDVLKTARNERGEYVSKSGSTRSN